jgi:hypothetical protein
MIQNQKLSNVGGDQNPDFNSLLADFEESITSQIQEKFNEIEEKL